MSLLTDASLILTPNAYNVGKLYSVIPNTTLGDMDVSRGSSATRVNSSGLIESVAINVPRIDYPPLGGCPSILVEPARTNWVLRSEEFGNWSTYNAIVSSNHSPSPNGTQTADLVYPSLTGDVSGQVYRNITTGVNLNDIVTVSAFVKSSNKNFAYIAPIQTTSFNPAAWFNLTTGAITNIIPGATASITAFPNGWWRISVTTTATAGSYNAIIGSTDIAGNNTNTASGTNGILVWGAQVEVGSNATSYIPTTTAAVPRAADVITRNNIYTNNLITSSGGTWFVELNKNLALTRDGLMTGLFLDTSTDSFTNGFNIRNTGGNSRLTITKWQGGGGGVLYTTTTDTTKIAIKWNGTTADIFANGVKVVIATPFTPTAMQFLKVDSSIGIPYNINQMALWKTALTDDQCILLTGPSFSSYPEMASALIYTLQ